MTQTVLEDVCPNGNIEAVVEQDDRVAFFYLRGAPDTEFGLRSCWVRNLKPAPAELDVSGMKRGVPPMLPRAHCAHPFGSSPLTSGDLRVVWFEEGDAAALLEQNVPIAVIPSWSGTGGFEGYARDCTSESVLCWPLTADNVLHQRIRAADEYWATWNADSSPWGEVQEAQLAAYAQQIGNYEKYYAIDANEWPPKAMVRTPVRGGFVLATIGVCLRPQPTVETATEDPERFRRIELGIAVAEGMSGFFEPIAEYLSAQSNLPWSVYSWLGPGHTIPCDAFVGTKLSAILLQYRPPGSPDVTLPFFRGDPVRLLWAVGITEPEREFAVRNGSGQLASRLEAAGVSWLTQVRQSVV